MALRGNTKDQIFRSVEGLTSFKVGNVSGSRTLNGTGRLDEEYASELRAADRAGAVLYVLYSYQTPMAWLLDDGQSKRWYRPEAKYSVSTTNHQTVFDIAIDRWKMVAV